MKLRTRFTLLFTLIVGVMLSFFSFAIYYLSEDYRQEDFHSRLRTRAIEKLDIFLTMASSTASVTESYEKDILHTLINEKFQIYDIRGNQLYSDYDTFPTDREAFDILKNEDNYTWSRDNSEGLAFIHEYRSDQYILFSSATDTHGLNYINNLKKILIVRLFIILLIIFISGWLFAGYFLRPLSNIVNQAEKITSSNLGFRLSTNHIKDEIGMLTTTFNKMLDRLETAFTIQKRFVSNASHELRNPLTAVSGQIDVALMKDRKKEEYRTVLESVQGHIKNLRTLSNNLLELANSDVQTLFQSFDEIRIDEILWGARDEIIKQKPEATVRINFKHITDNEKMLTCKGKGKLLELAFINIIDNGYKFSKDKTVEIWVIPEKNNILLSFSDKGIGMPSSYLEHIYEPFFRGSNTLGIPGKGIGLSLVQGIVKLHSGKIFIHSALNQGTTVKIVLPNLS